MAEAPRVNPRLNIVLMLTAMVTLATEVTRLVLEWSPSPLPQAPVGLPIDPVQPDYYDRRACDYWRERRPPLSRLPPDYSIRCPPWCRACRPPPRRVEWWRFDW
jgi:hypothetical protein